MTPAIGRCVKWLEVEKQLLTVDEAVNPGKKAFLVAPLNFLQDQWAVVDLVAAAAVVAATVAPVEATGVGSLVAEAASSVLETGSVPIRK